MRWVVPPIMVFAAVIGRRLGFEFEILPILYVATGILVYNVVLALVFTHSRRTLEGDPRLDRLMTTIQVVIDYTAVFLLIYYTGGPASPLVFFLIFHVVIAAIQFRPSQAFLFVIFATGGLWLMTLLQLNGVLGNPCIAFRGSEFSFLDWPGHVLVGLGFFTASLAIAAVIATRIMSRLRERLVNLAETTDEVERLNKGLGSLYAMLRAVGSEVRLGPMLDIVTNELAKILTVRVVAVKLLDEEGETLRFVAAHGLPPEFLDKKVQQPVRSPLNQRIIEGETLVHGRIDTDTELELHADLAELEIKSVVFTPLKHEDRIIGILAAYCHIPDRFDVEDTHFLRLAAELVAIAIENARGYEAIENLMHEHTKFMMQVAHNMRAPIGASLSMLQLLAESYLGAVNEEQIEYLKRVEDRLSSLNETIGELLTLGLTRDRTREIEDVRVDMNELVERVERNFRDEAEGKGLDFQVRAPGDLPLVDSGADLLEQVLENLVSNAIKYTPEGGTVELVLLGPANGKIEIKVRDTGIGIPVGEQEQLFKEFFRASNARKMREVGTGLGLAFVKQAVERHHGRLRVDSEEGRGTIVTLQLPVRQSVNPPA